MKTYSIDIFLSSGMVIRLERLSKSKLNKLVDIIETGPGGNLNVMYHVFKHEGCRHFIKPHEVAHYVTKKVIL